MKLLILLLSFVVLLAAGDQHLNANGPFGKRHTINGEPSPYNCRRPDGYSTAVNVADLNVSTTAYSSREELTVAWSPLSGWCKDDFIGVFFADIPLQDACGYVDYEFVQSQQSRMSWQMVSLRRPLDFRYYSREHSCSGNYSLIARSPTVQPLNYNEPTQIHIAYGDRIDQMFVSYLTNSSQYTPQCQYGLSPTSLNFQKGGTSTTYKASDMCEGKANITGPQNFIDPGYMHTILLEDLRPSTPYYYRVGTDEHGWSAVYSFTNRPASKEESVYIVAFGDMGLSPVELGAKPTIDRVTARVTTLNVTCLLHIGDISYARGIAAQWDAFMTQVQPIASRVPYMVGIGNHEYDHESGGERDPSHAAGAGGFRPGWGDYGLDSGGECAVPMVHRFHSPSNGNSLFWYSFDVGPVHIIVYSTEHDFRQGAPQYDWIEKDLRSVNRTLTPWLIVTGHRQMYTSEESSAGETEITEKLQLYLEPLLYQYHVDLNLFGHRHSYERTCPMYKNKCVSDGVTHILLGMAGQNLDSGKYSGAAWSKYHDQQFGYTTFYANQSHLQFTYYHDSDDKIADEFTLQK